MKQKLPHVYPSSFRLHRSATLDASAPSERHRHANRAHPRAHWSPWFEIDRVNLTKVHGDQREVVEAPVGPSDRSLLRLPIDATKRAGTRKQPDRHGVSSTERSG